jgi:streptogrisin C
VRGFDFRAAVAFTGVAIAALAGSSAVAAAAEKPAADQGAPLDVAADTYRQAFPGMSDGAARAAATHEDARKRVHTTLTSEDASTYGGAWFDPPTGVLHVAATTQRTAARAEQLARDLDVEVRTHLVQRSFAELERQATALREGSNVLARNARGQVGIDVEANRVVAAVPASSVRAVRQLRLPSAVSVVADPKLQVEEDAGCTSRSACDWTIRAGAMLWRGSQGNNVCSVGFTARNTANQRFTFTAGHCSNGNGVTWGTGGQYIGPMAASINSGSLDAAIIRVSNPWFTGDLGGEIYAEGAPGRTLPLNGAAPTVSYMLQGERVCLAANFTQPNGGNLCGVIGAVSDPAVLGKTRVDGLDACPGDSGGGWYWLTSTNRRIAYGLHSQSNTGCHVANGRSWYTPIATARNWSGLNIEVRP